MTTTDEPRCEICGSTEDVRIIPLMTGKPFTEPQEPICGKCFYCWYECGQTTAEGILRCREKSEAVT